MRPESTIHIPASRGERERVFALLREVGGAATAAGGFALCAAAEWGHLPLVRALCEAGADVETLDNIRRLGPLTGAASRGQTEVVAYLLDRGATVEPTSHSPLQLAAENRHPRVVALLLDAGADPNRRIDGVTPLQAALGYRDLYNDRRARPRSVDRRLSQVLRHLIGAGADIEARCNYHDWTALHLACDMFPFNYRPLIDAGADVNARTKTGATPLWMANARATAALLRAGADPLALDKAGRSALSHCACAAKAKLLLDAGCDPLPPGSTRSNAPFWCAIVAQREEVLALLAALLKQTNRSALLKDGLAFARERGVTRAAAVLAASADQRGTAGQ